MTVLVLAWAVPVGASGQQAVPASSASPLVLDGVTVVDVEQGKLIPDQRVVITGNRIQVMGGAGKVSTPKGAQVVEAKGKYVIPGLWDMHVHAQFRSKETTLASAPLAYALLLANGITGIREAGSWVPLDTLRRWRQEIVAGTRVGPPRQVLDGPYLDQGCPMTYGVCVEDADSAGVRRVVDSLKAAGADMIKVRGLGLPDYFVAVAEARRLGIPVGGHSNLLPALEAADSGVAIIDHIIGFDSPCWSIGLPLSLGSVEECRPVADRLRAKGTWLVPTIFVYAPPDASGYPFPMIGNGASALYTRSADRVREFWAGSVLRGNWLRDTVQTHTPGGLPSDSLGVMHLAEQAGLPVLAGTDAMHPRDYGFALHAELAMYAAEGMTPLAALQAATLSPAKFLHATDSLGTVAPGKLADLVLLDANPLEDITNTTTIRAVVANGRYFDRAALDQLLADTRAKARQEP